MLRRSIFLTLAALVFSASTASTAQATSITVSTYHVDANTQIDVDNWFVWTFSVSPTVTVDDILGSFVIKDNDAQAPITFSLFQANASAWTLADINTNAGTALDAFSLNPDDVDNSYGEELFPLGPSLNLTDSNPIYSLVLWSNTGGTGHYQYFFKGEDNQALVVTPCVIEGDNIECPDPGTFGFNEAPEPATVVLMLTGLAIIAVRRWRA